MYLLHAKSAVKAAQIREVSSHYPGLKKAGKHFPYESTLNLNT